MITTSVSLLTLLFLTSIASGQSLETNQTVKLKADTLITNAQIYTMDAASPWANTLAIKAGEIIYVGGAEEANALVDNDTAVHNLGGLMVLPGLHDVHIHPLESASDATHFSVPGAGSIKDYQDAIRAARQQHPEASWLIGYGHHIDTLLEMAANPKEVIDAVVDDRAVLIMEQTSHSMWANSKALKLAGIVPISKNPVGGVIGRDSSGELNGILYDNAGNQVMDVAMQSQGDEMVQNYDGFVEYTQPTLLAHGVTAISDARVYWQRGQLDTWLQLEADDALTMRVSLGLWAYPELDDDKQIAALASLYHVESESLLKVDQIKLYMDGILINTTAALKQPYHHDWLGLKDNIGLNYFSQARLQKYIAALAPMGFDFNIHTIGDRGVHEALNAIEAVSHKGARHRLTHVEVIDEKDIPRFAKLKVIADAQVAGDFANPEHWPDMIPLIGKQRAAKLIPIKALVEQGARLTLSSDWNVSSLNPFVGIANAISREPEAISLHQALAAYTINGAYAMRQEHLVGSLEVGKRADFIVLPKNLFTLSADQIRNVHVLETWIEGKRVYKAPLAN